mgnify:CR=1 FL=1
MSANFLCSVQIVGLTLLNSNYSGVSVAVRQGPLVSGEGRHRHSPGQSQGELEPEQGLQWPQACHPQLSPEITRGGISQNPCKSPEISKDHQRLRSEECQLWCGHRAGWPISGYLLWFIWFLHQRNWQVCKTPILPIYEICVWLKILIILKNWSFGKLLLFCVCHLKKTWTDWEEIQNEI